MVADCTKRIQEALRVLRRLETAHDSFTLTRRLMRILCSVVEPFVPPMFSSGKHSPKRRRIAREFVGDHHARLGPGCDHHTPQERFGCVFIPTLRHQASRTTPCWAM